MLRVTDPLSACAFKITVASSQRTGGTATAFLYFCDGRTFLVTARHNLTCKNALTGLPLSRDRQFVPELIRFRLPYESRNEAGEAVFGHNDCSIKLREEGEAPVWRVHDPDDLRFDCAVIDLGEVCLKRLITDLHQNSQEGTFLADTALLASSSEFQTVASGMSARLATVSNLASLGLDLRVGEDLLILGFPQSIEIGPGLPLWKRATLASEPYFAIEGMPYVLVDTATRKGMSGSPVVIRQTRGSAQLPRGILSLQHGEVNAFVGVYTSRDTGSDEFEAQLGRVWTREHMIAIMSDGRPDQARS